jgi:hypothetical protein
MGANEYSKYNKEKNMSIEIKFNKVCYFPEETISGTITLFPFLQSFEQLRDKPQLNITILQKQHYNYSSGGKHKRYAEQDEDLNLVNITINFKDKISTDYLSGFSIPFSIQLPKNAYPSIVGIGAFVKHYFIVELPHVDVKRTKLFIVKHHFPNNNENNLLLKNFEQIHEYKKSNLLAKKGSCFMKIKMPKNYFYYNEKILFDIFIDRSKFEMEIKSVGIILVMKQKLNSKEDRSNCRSCWSIDIGKKFINLEKGLSNYNISDFIEFPDTTKGNPDNIYKSLEEHGILEVNESKFKYYLYPSSILGLVSIEYGIRVELNFDSKFTFDEEFFIPLYFSANPKPEISSQ